MVRETRHLWVGNLPDNIREDRIREHFKRYGRVQNVKLLGRMESPSAGTNTNTNSGVCATVAFMDIKSASKAHNVEHVLDERTLTTEYYEPAAIPSSAGAPSAGSSPAGSGYSGSSSSVNSTPAPASTSRYHLSGEESAGNACAMAASAAAPATWRGTNDSATDFCRRGNTPAAYGRTTPHHRWYAATGTAATAATSTGTGTGAAGIESTPSTPGGGTERRRRLSGSGSSRSESSSPEPSDTSRASTPATHHVTHHNARRTPPPPHQWPSTANGRPLAICVRNLPTRSTDSSLKDGLYHEYKKHGKVVWVKVVGQNADRYAVVRFKKPSDVEKALEVSQDKLFFGCKISVAPHQSCDDDAESAKPYETDIDEYHPKATRTLFIGNLEKDVTQQQLRDKFKHFGRIIEIDIKKGSGGGAGYAFCQYASISSVVEAIRAMDGEYVGSSRVKLGFGKPVATTCVWVDGLTEHTEKQVLGAVSRCGAATSVCVDRAAGAALVHFEQAAAAGGAVRELRRVAAQLSAAEPDHPRLCVDYASRECQEAFYEQLEKHGGSAALAGAERSSVEVTSRYLPTARHESLRVYDEPGSSPQTDEATYEDRLQSVVVSPHRAHKHRRDSSTEDRKHSKERHRSVGGGSRRSRSGSRGHISRRRHRRRRDGSGSRGSHASRTGTPLRDEPDAIPTEPRRPPRERPPLPMSLPLPKFAVQLLRAVPTQPRLLPPAPASPPRPPSVSSSSGGSAPHSPSLEERIRSLDEKYERWTGSRAHADAPDRTRLRHRLLELDINEVKPSEVVLSLLAKRSVFDEDSERLEGVRVPSPGGSPRSLPTPLSRVLRYPIPMYTQTVNASMTTSNAIQPPEPEENEVPRIEKQFKVDMECESRLRRTPSIDKSSLDIVEKKKSPTVEKFDVIDHTKRRNSVIVTDEKPLVTDAKPGIMEIKPLVPELRLEKMNSDKTLETIMILEVKEKSSLKEVRPNCEEKESIDEKKTFKTSDPIASNFQQNCIRDVTKLKHDDTKLIKEIQIELNRTEKYFFSKSDFDIKTEASIQEDIKHQLEQETKLHETSFRLKNEAVRCQEKPFQNHVGKESVSYRIHTANHLNSVSCIELSKREEVSNQEIKNERTKEKIDVNSILFTKDENTKSKEDNIESEKVVDKIKTPTDILFSPDLTSTETGKSQEEHLKNDREKLKHRDRVDIEKEKSKINKVFKLDRNDKDRKIKDDSLNIKPLHEKVEKVKTEKENEIVIEKEREFDKAKPHHNEEKFTRHDNHKKDKEKKRELSEVDILTKTIKRDEKNYKHEKPRKDNENKRDIKKEPETSKNRKSSRDESSRDICRKDSTDSTTSRASHDSTTAKSRDLENIEPKEESKFKTKYFEIDFRDESGKESTRSHDQGKLENKTRIKNEVKEGKDFVEQHLKNKIKEEKDYSDRYYKSKIESYTDSTPKCKTEVSEKQRHYSLDSPSIDSKRKERLNSCSSLPSHIGHKRRMSSQDSIEYSNEDTKKIKSDRRDLKDLRSLERHKTTKFSKGHFAKIIESKTKDDKKNQVKPPDDISERLKDTENKNVSSEKNKSLKTSPLLDIEDKLAVSSDASTESLQNNIDFLATLELRSSEEDERQKALRKEMKEKKRIQQLQQIQELQMQQDALQHAELTGKTKDDRKQKHEEKKKDSIREKRMSTDRKSRDEKNDQSKRRNRKLQSTDSSDSDEPKKHSIFDIIDDGPCLSMYDKVKARSCKNMQKQEEEKRQEKIKAKFSQLKQSRAKREEKKRSSWDEDSDSENDRRKSHKTSIDTSSDDDQVVIQSKKREKSHGSSLDFDLIRTNDYFDMVSNEEDSSHHKLSRKNSRSRILSDSSDEENIKRVVNKSPCFIDKIKKEIFSDSESSQKSREIDLILKESSDDKIKKTSLLNLFGKSDSEDNRLKTNLDIESDYRITFPKNFSNDISSENESLPSNRNSCEIRKKHKKKQKKYKFSFSDEEVKLENHDITLEGGIKHKHPDKRRRHSNKKDKRKDKIRESVDTDEPREEKMKLKRDKFSPNQSYDLTSEPLINSSRKDGKMEDIFGPLSDESDKEMDTFSNKTEFDPTMNAGLIDKVAYNSDELLNKEDFKRKRDKKRKERTHFTKDDDNSLDVDAVSKAIEASLFAETSNLEDNRTEINDVDGAGKSSETDLKYIDINNKEDLVNCNKYDKIKKESRDKKKKKKKNKEDRQSRKEHHHGYHLEKSQKTDDSYIENSIQLSPKTMLLDIPLPNDIQKVELVDKSDDSKSLSKSPSLPTITDSPPFVENSGVNNEFINNGSDTPNRLVMDDAMGIDFDLTDSIEVNDIPMPPPIDNIVQDISEVPLPKDPPVDVEKSKSILSSFDHEMEVNSDLRSSEDAVRSITNIDIEPDKQGDKINNDPHSKIEKKTEEKPRAIISQEETEDAVAALLGESFGGKTNTFVNCYEEVENNTKDQIEIESTPAENENIPEEDAEEMRQAVQNLNASEMEIKPDTPVSDNDDLLIDTDTEEADETTQDAIERLPINIISTNPSLGDNTKVNLPRTNTEVSNQIITKQKPNIVHSKESNESKKSGEDIVKPIYVKSIAKQDNVQQVTSTATPVITSWTLSNNKLIESPVLNIPVSSMSSRDNNDNKPSHITANILQIKASQNQNVQICNSTRPVISANRIGPPYKIINQMIRPQVTCMQPPTIKIPEPHVIYQKPQGILISPRMTNETLLLSPKTNHQTEGITSPRLSNMTILSSSPQNMNSVGLASPNSIQQRSPGQVTVVRMQQPPLSPIQTMQIPHGSRAIVSPNRPSSVLVQAQGTPIHFSRLPVTPVLAPIPKQLNANIIHQTKGNVGNSQMLHQSKIITGDNRNSENRSETAKIILSPTRLQQSSNPTVAKNRLISMQNALHVGGINSPLHISNKVLVKNKGQLLDIRENQSTNNTEQNHKTSHAPTPIIHVASVNHSSPSIIQGTAKPVMCSLQNAVTVNKGHGSNVIHTINSQRLLTTSPMGNVIQLDRSKGSSPPSVLSVTNIRPSILGKSESNTVVVTTSSLTNVVMTPMLLKGSSSPKPTIRLHSRSESEYVEPIPCISHKRDHDYQRTEQSSDVINESIAASKNSPVPAITPMETTIARCETDFEELLKDNTNEIKKTNHPEKKVEINVGRNITIISQNHDRRKSIENVMDAENSMTEENVKNLENVQGNENNKNTENTNSKENIKCIENMNMEKNQSLDNDKNEIEIPTSNAVNENQIGNKQKDSKALDIKTVSDIKECSINISKQEKNDTSIPTVQEATEKNKGPHDNDDKCMNTNVEENKNQFFGFLSDQNQNSFNEIKNIDESDYWSAKDVNIESVIKKVDSLCKDILNEKKEAIEDADSKPNEKANDDVVINIPNDPFIEERSVEICKTESSKDIDNKDELNEVAIFNEDPILERSTQSVKRGGRNSNRGKKSEKTDRIQARQISRSARGTSKRGRGRVKVDKKIKDLFNSNLNNIPGDVYDFHEDSGDETVTSPNKTEARPRLILTIKSPLSGHTNSIATSTLSITQKDQVKKDQNKLADEIRLCNVSASTINTRKSRRLQEKDILRSTVDDVIDDVIKGSSAQFKSNTEPNRKRTTRQAGAKTVTDKVSLSDIRKSPRAMKRTRDRRLSEASVGSSDENAKRQDAVKEPKIPKLPEAIELLKSEEIKTTVVSNVIPTTNPTPIMKPPKKMISEISAKLACAFETAVNANSGNRIGGISPNVAERHTPSTERQPEIDHIVAGVDLIPVLPEAISSDAGYGRRIVDNVPTNMMPVGATEATDARVQSPALPHRPPSAHRPPDRVTPILVRGGEGDGGAGVAVAAAAGASRFRGAYAGPASLPRGAHHPLQPHQPSHAKQVAVALAGPQQHHPGSRVTITSVPSVSPQGQMPMGEGMYPHFSQHHYQMYQQHFRATQYENVSTLTTFPTRSALEAEGSEAPTPPLELRRPPSARVPRPAHSPSPHDRHIMYGVRCGRSPPPAHGTLRPPSALPPPGPPGPPHASQVPREADSLQMLLRRYPVMWQGLLALKNDSAAVQMHFVGGNPGVAADALARNADGTAASLLRIAQRMRLEPAQLDQVHRKMKLENEHCTLLALPCGRDHMDVLQQSTNLTAGFITYLQRKQAAGIVNVAPPGHQQSLYTVHIFPSCDFANENLNRIAPDLMHRVANIAHLLIVIATAIG